ncbi:Mth938-like domain-containing protein [Halocynthiibacter namhaensis]|uniref:Mth938-like domain-containing protein n=1 Tax=Halocynthiibacter namhaensis TaxID=1290553 RepID=UPI0005795917|nr:Mth938-like domain-containing protein [Halocynthiibacter namhaensis]
MRLNEISYTDAKPVDGYGPGFFRVGGEVFEGHVIVSPKGVTAWGGYDDVTAITDVLAGEIDVVFCGTGADIAHPPKAFREALEAAGIGVEPMSSPSAARSYNILLSEGRRIAAAMLTV